MFFQNSNKTVILSGSASWIYRLTEGLQRVVEGPRGCLLADALHSFSGTKTIGIERSQPRAKPRICKFRGPSLGCFSTEYVMGLQGNEKRYEHSLDLSCAEPPT